MSDTTTNSNRLDRVKVMEAAVQIMEDEGVEFVFGIPGAAILPLYQASASPRRSATSSSATRRAARTPPTPWPG